MACRRRWQWRIRAIASNPPTDRDGPSAAHPASRLDLDTSSASNGPFDAAARSIARRPLEIASASTIRTEIRTATPAAERAPLAPPSASPPPPVPAGARVAVRSAPAPRCSQSPSAGHRSARSVQSRSISIPNTRFRRRAQFMRTSFGLFPPIRGDAALEKAAAPYAGPKGDLRFPFDEPIPYGLIKRLTRLRARQDRERHAKR